MEVGRALYIHSSNKESKLRPQLSEHRISLRVHTQAGALCWAEVNTQVEIGKMAFHTLERGKD